VVEEILEVLNMVPVPRDVPPFEAAYQLRVPVDAAESGTDPGPQLEPGVVELTVEMALTVATTEVLADVHPLFVASTK